MKKILFAIAIVLTLGMTANAQGRDAFFYWNDASNETFRDPEVGFVLPTGHGSGDDFTAPLGSGLLVLTALGAGYALRKKKNNE